MTTIAQQVRAELRRLNLTQAETARRVGEPAQSIKDVTTGRKRLSADLLRKLAVVGVRPMAVLGLPATSTQPLAADPSFPSANLDTSADLPARPAKPSPWQTTALADGCACSTPILIAPAYVWDQSPDWPRVLRYLALTRRLASLCPRWSGNA